MREWRRTCTRYLTRLIQPAGDSGAGEHARSGGKDGKRILKIYGRKNGTWQVQPPMASDGPYKYIWGAGGLISTARDYMQFEEMLLNRGMLNDRRLLKPETVALMSRNHVGTLFAEWIPAITAGIGFGLGVMVVEDESKANGGAAGASGWGGAYGTESWADPQLGVAAVMFILMQPAPGNVKNEFQQALRRAIVA